MEDTQHTHATRLFLVRHGQTALSHDDTFCGVTEASLTETGRAQAQRLAERLCDERIDAIYCSPQHRSLETVEPIAHLLRLELHLRDALREMNFGQWENRTRSDLMREYPKEFSLWERGSWMAQPPDGETQQEVIARAVPCLIDILHEQQGRTVLIVGHKSNLRLLLGNLLNMSLPDSRSLHIEAASLSELSITGDQVELRRLNDTRHLT